MPKVLKLTIMITANSKQQNKKSKKDKQNDLANKAGVALPNNFEPDTKNSKKKTKYVNLYSQEGKNAQVVLLKGILIKKDFYYVIVFLSRWNFV